MVWYRYWYARIHQMSWAVEWLPCVYYIYSYTRRYSLCVSIKVKREYPRRVPNIIFSSINPHINNIVINAVDLLMKWNKIHPENRNTRTEREKNDRWIKKWLARSRADSLLVIHASNTWMLSSKINNIF